MVIVTIFQLMAAVIVSGVVVTVGQAENNRLAYEKEVCQVKCDLGTPSMKSEYHIVKGEKAKCYCVAQDGSLIEKK